MMKARFNSGITASLLAALMLAGCATPPGPPEPQASIDEVAAAAAEIAAALPPAETPVEYGQFPREVLTRVILAEMAGQRGGNRQALNEYLALARETGDISIIKRASRIAAYLHDVRGTLEMADLWLEREPDSPEARRTLAFQMLALGRYREALEHMVRLQELGREVDFRLLATRVVGDDDTELFIDAMIEDFRNLAQRFPGNPSLHLGLSQLYRHNDQPRVAWEQLDKLPEEQRGDPDVVLLEVRLLESMGEEQRARDRLENSLRERPDARELRFHFARRLIQDRDYAAAREQFAHLVEQNPRDYDMIYSLALINLELDRPQEARRYFQRLVDGNAEQNDNAHFYLGRISQQENQPRQAIEHFMQVQSGPNFLQAQRHLTTLLVRQDRYPEARERLQRIRYTKPDHNAQLLIMEASVLLEEDLDEQAGKLLDSALAAFPDNVQLLYLRSVLNQERGDLAKMEKDLRRIIELEPDSAMAYNTLGYVLADRTDRYEEAYELIRRAIELAPNDPAIIDSLGWVQYRLGMYEEALENLDRAFSLYPDHEVAAHLGEVLWVTGQREAANEIWREALERKPDSEPVLDAMQRLKSEQGVAAD